MVPMLWFEDTKSITAASEDQELGRAMLFVEMHMNRLLRVRVGLDVG